MEGKKRVVPGEVCVECPERGNRHRKVTLSAQKSAEAIVPERGRAESIGVPGRPWKGGMNKWMQNTSEKMAAHREIVRNTKGM